VTTDRAGRLVWLSTLRKGIAWHEVAGRRTVCGRFVGDGLWLRGNLLSPTEAAEYQAVPCKRCTGSAEVVEPRGVPSRDRRG
jgi:hypothetical protein